MADRNGTIKLRCVDIKPISTPEDKHGIVVMIFEAGPTE